MATAKPKPKSKQKQAGRPAMYKTVKEMAAVIEDYFKECEGTVLSDKNGQPVLDKYNRPIIIDAKPPTITGLALALGFTGRQALLNYQVKDEFMDTILRAKSRVEQYAEERLFDRDGVRGSIFSLSNNFKGWSTNPQEVLSEQPSANHIIALANLLNNPAPNRTQREVTADGEEE